MSDPRFDWLGLTDDQIDSEVLRLGIAQTRTEEGPSFSFTATVMRFVALVVRWIFRVAIRPIGNQFDPRRATGEYLNLAGVLAGVPVRAARPTRGHATVTSAAGGRVRQGERIEAGGQGFTVDYDAQLAAGAATSVAITAEVAGPDGNVAAGTAAAFASPPQRAPDATVRLDADWIRAIGFDADDPTDDPEPYRERVLAGLGVRGFAEIEARYRLAALGVEGCTAAQTVRTPRGLGSVDLLVLFGGRLPTDSQLADVRAALREAQLTGADVVVRGPTTVSVTVTAEITGTALTTDAEAAILAWWRANVGIGADVLVQSLYADATAGLPGLTSIVYRSPLSNLDGSRGLWFSPVISVTAA